MLINFSKFCNSSGKKRSNHWTRWSLIRIRSQHSIQGPKSTPHNEDFRAGIFSGRRSQESDAGRELMMKACTHPGKNRWGLSSCPGQVSWTLSTDHQRLASNTFPHLCSLPHVSTQQSGFLWGQLDSAPKCFRG